MDNILKKVTLKLLVKIFNTKRVNSVKFIYMVNSNLIESGYELRYYSMGIKKISGKKGIK